MIVLIEEEYGYRNWLWMPDMSKEEVIDWWKNLSTVGTFFFGGWEALPGEIHQIYLKRSPHDAPEEDHDSSGRYFCVVTPGEGHTLDQISEFIELPENAWYIHMHTDNDSILIADDKQIHHAGYVTNEEYYSEDYEPSDAIVEACNNALEKFLKDKLLKEPHLDSKVAEE